MASSTASTGSPLARGLRVELADQGHRAALAQPVHEALDAGVDDDLGLRHRRLPAGLALLHHGGEVVDGVEVHVLQGLDLGLDVARYRQVDHEHRAVPALAQGALDRAQADQRQGAGGAAHHDVEVAQPRGQVGQPHRLAAEARGEPFAALGGAIGDGDRFRLAGGEMRRGQLDHLAGTDEQDARLAQVLEELAGQAHGGGGHADGMRADLGGGAHFLGDGEGALEQLVERAAQGASGLGGAHGVLHLAEDLRLAQHHRIESARDTEGVTRDGVVVQGVGVRAQHVAADAAAVGQPADGVVERGLVVRHPVDLGAVAGRDDRGLDLGVAAGGEGLAQAVEGRGDLVDRERETTAQIERRGRVVQAEGPD
jgi:hypothetical protein